jgi:hypothetical protein
LGNRQHIAFFERTLLDKVQGFTQHTDLALGHRDAFCDGLVPDIHHSSPATLIEMR